MSNSSISSVCESVNDDGRSTSPFEPIAIIGMGMRLPGAVHNAADYWDMLINGKSGQCRVPKSRYNVDAWKGQGRVNHVPTEFGYFLQELNLAHVDPSFWSFTKQEAELMDPRQRLFLEVAYEAFQTSGAKDIRGTDVGVYVGTMGDDWSQIESHDEQNLNQVRPDVYGDYIIANRASYEFDLTGPSMVIRTACSASMVALHTACRDLHSGDCTSALVGGVNIILTPRDTAVMHQQGVLSPTASCKSFDADADGFARGEGVSAVYIKKLSDAVRDGDPVRAVIRSTCVAGNGRTPGLTTPNPKIHEKLMRRGHSLAGIQDLSKTAMVECHGTGTSVGDPLEVSAVANIWGDHGIYIGSVKPNIGHGEGASGLSSVIKMVLALENSTIPPNINFKTPNPNIPWEAAKLKVPTEPMPWPTYKLERVSVNSFGIGGSNANVLLESASCFGVAPRKAAQRLDTSEQRLLVLSAAHSGSVKKSASDIEQYLAHNPGRLSDVAYSLASRRDTHNHRAFCVTDGKSSFQLSKVSKTTATSIPPCLIWVFTGQGAQWAQMGKELLEHNSFFRQRISDLNGVLKGLPNPPSWTLQELLLAPKNESQLAEAELSQPCLAALQIALVDLLRSWGVTPTAVVGHSSGETAAAYASGAITADDAIRIAYHRGQITLLIKAAHDGSMAAVGLGRDQVNKFLLPGVIIGCENSPSNVTLSGEAGVLENVMRNIREEHPDILVRSLRVECGYHSHHMNTAAADFSSRLEGLFEPKKPTIPFYSSVSGNLNQDMTPAYWVRNVTSPVLFNTAVQTLLDDFDLPTFVEIGPHSALEGPMRQILSAKNKQAHYIPTLIRNRDAVSCVLRTAGELWTAGSEIDLAAVCGSGEFLTDLPTYAWHYDGEYWMENRLSRTWRLREFDHHELLGTRVQETSDACPAWRCHLRVEDAPWLRDHVVLGEVVFPAAGFIAMVGEALRQMKGSPDYTVGQVRLDSTLVLNEGPVELVTTLHPPQSESSSDAVWYDFSISSLNEGSETWIKHVTGRCRAGSEYQRLPQEVPTLPRKVSASSFYSTWKRFGINYGITFRNLVDVTSHVREPTSVATLHSQLSPRETAYSIHPTLLDSSMHFSMISSSLGLEKNFRQLSIPTYIEEVYVSKPSGKVRMKATAARRPAGKPTSEVIGFSDGSVVIDIRGLEVNAAGDNSAGQNDDSHAGAIVDWKPDIDFLDPSQFLFRRDSGSCVGNLDRMVLACIVESRAQLQFLPATQPHLVQFKSWLDASYRQAVTGEYPDVLDAFDIATMNSKPRQMLISQMLRACEGTPVRDLALAVHRVFSSGSTWFSGRLDGADLFSDDGSLASLAGSIDLTEFIQLLDHKSPGLNILFIGAALEKSVVFESLASTLSTEDGSEMYGNHVFTGKSSNPPGFMEKHLKRFRGSKYSQLDIANDPVAQGFKEESFDLILLLESTTTPDSLAATKNIRKLLKPTGRLVLQQPNPDSRALQYILGLLPSSHVRLEGLSEDVLREHLSQAGFDGSKAATFTVDHATLTITKPFMDNWMPTRASVLCKDPTQSLVREAVSALQSRGLDLDFCSVGQELPWGQPVFCLLDIECPFFYNATKQQWEDLQKTMFSAQDEKVIWVTGASQINCVDPNYSLALGFARTLRRELSMDVMTLELDSFNASGWDAMFSLFETLERRFTGGDVDPEPEYAFSQGQLNISRFRPVKILEQLRGPCQSSIKQLNISGSGSMKSLEWRESPAVTVEGDLIEVEVKAVGLNARDLQTSTGKVTKGDDGSGDFGLEGSGIVRRVGPDAGLFRVGDRVAFNHQACLATSITLSETLCARVPDIVSFEEAASTPYTYGTAIHAVLELGKLRQGQSILIHEACNAVGLAAIQIARTISAEIYCTVDSSEKRSYLTSSYRLPESHVLSPKDSSFHHELLSLTGNRGVDLALGAFSGKALRGSWECVAPFGTMIQMGQTGSVETWQVHTEQLSQGRAFMSSDLEELRIRHSKECTRLLEQAFMFSKLGLNQPAQPITTFDAVNPAEAFRSMQKQQNIGRTVVMMPENGEGLTAVALKPRMELRPDRTYVFVGGLGGLGQSTARFLAEHGARDLVFFSRSAEESAKSHPEYFEELQAMGCTVQAISGSVNNISDVTRMMDSKRSPIGGVMQAAMVLQDVHITDMTFDQWQVTVKPKVQGTWNLHHALQAQSEPLDFFFLFSSLSGLGGQIGQANYAAGNAFLDAFVQYRHSRGLACSVLDIGLMEDIGVLTREQNRLEALRATSHSLHEQDLLDALELMIRRSQPAEEGHAQQGRVGGLKGYFNPSQVAIGLRSSSASASNRTGWSRDRRAAFVAQASGVDEAGDDCKLDGTLKEFLKGCTADPTILDSEEAKTFLAKEIGAALQGFAMGSDGEVDLSRPLQTDSLVTVELRNWFRQKMGVSLTVMEMRGAQSIYVLGELAAVRLASMYVSAT